MLTALASTDSTLTQVVETAIALVAISCIVAAATRLVRVPYTVALVLTGLGIAAWGYAPEGAWIRQDVVLMLFLPPLLFQAGLHTDLDHLRKVWLPVLLCAFPGVILTSVVVALCAWPMVERGLGGATIPTVLLLGVMLAPTDPISVMSVFKTAGVPEKLKTMVEGESLFNDGTAVALFGVLKAAGIGTLAAATTYDAPPAPALDLLAAVFAFVKVAGLGSLIGILTGLGALFILRRLNDRLLETAVSVALAWGTFILAERFHGSGVIAVVCASLIIGNYGRVLSMSRATRRTLESFWDSVDFIVNSVLFLLIGIELSDPNLGGARQLLDGHVLLTAGLVFAALLAGRAAVVYPVVVIVKPHWPKGWKHVIWFAGLRGSLSLAMVLGLPEGEVRRFFAPVVFLVVLASLVLQASSMGLWIKAVRGAEKLNAGS
ncbi:MAG: sodium:proton antiporter [Planctomycetota bacterium]|nr:MAG: sodium:proton antiporter [Planctomycetota bacterium]